MRLSAIKSIGEKREKDFARLGIESVEDLLSFYPRAYLDLTQRSSLKGAYHNDVVLVACEVNRLAPVHYGGSKKTVKAFCSQDGYPFSAVWFNQPYVAQKLKPGSYLFYGRVQNKYGQISLVNPTFEPLDRTKNLQGIVPVYPLSGGLTQKVVRSAVREGLRLTQKSSVLPYAIEKKYNFSSLSSALFKVHAPKSLEDISEGAERIALEEYFILLSAFQIIKGGKENVRLHKYTVTATDIKRFAERFPFTLTEGQKSAVNEVFESLHAPVAMNRLLQGDVGSGKTAVALCGIFMALKSGYTAAYLSPTEVLAEQNYTLLREYFPEYAVGYLAGGMTAKEKRETKEKIARGEIDIVCGTHAILQADVAIPRLAFIVCDEQHRFGVAQRNALAEKGNFVDTLVMSATPIPRTLSLIVYGDLDVTTMKDKPKERQEIATSLIGQNRYDDMLDYIARETKGGKQAYFVCPKIEDDDGEGSLISVKELFEELKGRLPYTRFALLHGKMKEKEKTQIMSDFKAGVYDCLVSTTVIEVGVDVPNATMMVIYNAERFGLSQLHQLRGRVGRGAEKSYCFLLVGSDTPEAKERLTAFKNTTDGFEIAEKDLEMRGGGDFLGTRQSGKMLREIKNLRYGMQTVLAAKKLCEEAFSGGYDLSALRVAAMKKYEALKDVVLN